MKEFMNHRLTELQKIFFVVAAFSYDMPAKIPWMKVHKNKFHDQVERIEPPDHTEIINIH